MLREQRIERTHEQIREALKAYSAHTYKTEIMDSVTDEFIERLAEDAVDAKADLRNILSQSPAWNEDLDCLVINGNRTHEPDYDLIYKLAYKLLTPAMDKTDGKGYTDIQRVIEWFCHPERRDDEYLLYFLNRVAPRAYAPGKKLSKVFMAICKALNIKQDREFNQKYAILADELSAKKIDFKLYLSINPAHFLTMSNPKGDNRGEMLTSCHSLNYDDGYSNGCAGYARDNVTMIAFTVADDNDAESQYNRKTSRQLFMYQANNGLLLQSRFYNSQAYGGTRGEQPESKLYRELVQKELADGENAANLWNTYKYYDNSKGITIKDGLGFGGYADWPIEDFCAKISIRKDHADDYEAFSVGTYGLCIECAEEISGDGLFCDEHGSKCAECGERHDESDMYYVHNEYDDEVYVCESCLNEHYRYCEHCGEYYHEGDSTYIECDDVYVCDDCRDRYYTQCDECGEWFRTDDCHDVRDRHGNWATVCNGCLEDYYTECEECGEYIHNDNMTTAHKDGYEIDVCDDCLNSEYTECEECGEWFHNDDLDENNRCPDCHEDEEAC